MGEGALLRADQQPTYFAFPSSSAKLLVQRQGNRACFVPAYLHFIWGLAFAGWRSRAWFCTGRSTANVCLFLFYCIFLLYNRKGFEKPQILLKCRTPNYTSCICNKMLPPRGNSGFLIVSFTSWLICWSFIFLHHQCWKQSEQSIRILFFKLKLYL